MNLTDDTRNYLLEILRDIIADNLAKADRAKSPKTRDAARWQARMAQDAVNEISGGVDSE